MTETKFKDLSFWLKVGIIGGWISIVIYTISFLVGFLGGLTV